MDFRIGQYSVGTFMCLYVHSGRVSVFIAFGKITIQVKDILNIEHMPLFFVFSGFLLEGNRGKEYLTYKAKRLLIPYVGYLLVDFLLVRRDYSMNSLIHAFYGGRAFSGVYWYITCFLFTLAIFSLLLKLYPDKKVKRFILIGGQP